jgi:hypothetical protein
MSEAERDAELANRPEPQRAGLERKIAEYTAMSATERELRLKATELRYYLLPMMRMSEEEQKERMQSVPEDVRSLLEERLTQWNVLIPPDFQQQLIDNQAALQLFSRMHPEGGTHADELIDELHLSRLAEMRQDYDRWQALSRTQQTQLLNAFNHFFQLTAVEKQRTLYTLSEPERRAMEATLEEFEALSPGQRKACVYGFQQFLMMPANERARFLKNADRWQAMSPEDRQEWRSVVTKLSQMPPPPPGVDHVLVLDVPPIPLGMDPPPTARTN